MIQTIITAEALERAGFTVQTVTLTKETRRRPGSDEYDTDTRPMWVAGSVALLNENDRILMFTLDLGGKPGRQVHNMVKVDYMEDVLLYLTLNSTDHD